eukprot:g31954.t1
MILVGRLTAPDLEDNCMLQMVLAPAIPGVLAVAGPLACGKQEYMIVSGRGRVGARGAFRLPREGQPGDAGSAQSPRPAAEGSGLEQLTAHCSGCRRAMSRRESHSGRKAPVLSGLPCFSRQKA